MMIQCTASIDRRIKCRSTHSVCIVLLVGVVKTGIVANQASSVGRLTRRGLQAVHPIVGTGEVAYVWQVRAEDRGCGTANKFSGYELQYGRASTRWVIRHLRW